MELKEMPNTGVIINTEEELKEYLQICEYGGWSCTACLSRSKSYTYNSALEAQNNAVWTSRSNNSITLTEFKERQGIMKYKQGDVLVSQGGQFTREIQGNIGKVYFSIDEDGDARVDAELELNGYTLKTDEPEVIELTLEEVAELKGVPVDQIRIKD